MTLFCRRLLDHFCRKSTIFSAFKPYQWRQQRTEHILAMLAVNPTLQELVKRRCRPDVAGHVSRLVDELAELEELRKDQDLASEVEKDINNIYEKFKNIQPIIVNDLTKNEDFFIDSIVMEVSCGVGGQEAMLFAAEMLQLYQAYSSSKGWMISDERSVDSYLGGIRSASMKIEGPQTFYHLRHEAGVHRVQRVPKTEKSGRIHTSTIAVHVIPLKEGKTIKINDNDLSIQTKRSTGAGGQHVNMTESAIVITHIPTGIVVECQEERQQKVNKKKALAKLEHLLILREKERILDEYEKTKSDQVKNKSRSEKVRTYNFPQDRITDHRLSENLYDIKSFMAGSSPDKLDHLIQRLNDEMTRKSFEELIQSSTLNR